MFDCTTKSKIMQIKKISTIYTVNIQKIQKIQKIQIKKCNTSLFHKCGLPPFFYHDKEGEHK